MTDGKLKDPRPDLGETFRWDRLLELAFWENETLAYALHLMRSYGVKLGWTSGGRPKIAPVIGPQSWETKEEYDAAADQYLRPHKDSLVACLAKLADLEAQIPEGVEGIARQESPFPQYTGKTIFVAQAPQARRKMQELCPWAWVFNLGEVTTIARSHEVDVEFLFRGRTGSVFKHEKEKERWYAMDD